MDYYNYFLLLIIKIMELLNYLITIMNLLYDNVMEIISHYTFIMFDSCLYHLTNMSLVFR